MLEDGSRACAGNWNEGDSMTMTMDKTRGAVAVTGRRLEELLAVRAEERDLGLRYSRTMLRVDRMIAEELSAGVTAAALSASTGLSVALIEERAARHWRLRS